MTRIELLPGVVDDLDRIFDHLHAHAVPDAMAHIEDIVSALDILASHPRIGRRFGTAIARDHRELVIGRGARGYVALYHYDEPLDVVFVLAIRHQREAGFGRP